MCIQQFGVLCLYLTVNIIVTNYLNVSKGTVLCTIPLTFIVNSIDLMLNLLNPFVCWRELKSCKIKLMKWKALRKHSLHEKTAASVLLKPFISSNE